ncbi:MAG: bifunctional proline dehydrogenase/L-glutamate gamma-semialdehyde dehydrogenase, partial [Acidimicrobiales bacterium]|nr:bifunctional proline dehydrogenase/L-glutamate gamma-semialdehyde dehydrogenase [Acidimicrobiales bacterium]
TKDVTLELVRELLDDPALAGLYAGVVLQAYLKDCHADLSEVISFGADRLQTMPGAKPIHVRLVKGAYWDTETVQAEAEGWPAPVFADKGQTDANYERCTRLLHEHHGEVRSAFGSHNLRSLAYAVTDARHRGIPDSGYELQLLYGMAEPVSAALQRLGLRLRVYAPMGELVPGMSYLVRRLLENTANESFVRHRFAEGRSLDELVAPPPPVALPGPDPLAERPATDPEHPGPYRHEPRREWRRRSARSCFGDAVAELGQRLAQGPRLGQRLAQGPRLGQRLAQGNGIEVPALIGGEPVRTGATIVQVDPADPEVVVSTSASAGVAEADQAVASCLAAWERWSMTPARERAGVAFRAAEVLRRRRDELAALCVFEAGKPWADADGDVCEAIDFCEYYGREALRLERGGPVQSPPGETNVLRYQGKGVAAVIGPWNFPLAIPTGMTLAALMAGNAVVLKPAEQTPAIAAALVDVLLAAGLPPSVLAFLPGRGEVVGERLVAHPDVALVAFTGSRDVGLAINRAAAEVAPGQRHVKRVVAEMGGKNAMVIDADADLDQAVPAVVSSAFDFAGQKCSACSRVVAVEAIHDRLVERLVGAAKVLGVGHPRHPATVVGPLIDADALARVQGYLARAPKEGRVVLEGCPLPERGWFVGPTVVDDVAPGTPLAREEIFGPVLAVLRASSFHEALSLANDTDYALTAGVFSRSPAHIATATAELRAGNVYVNRGITGAVPGRQPFGGFGMSGVGSKAGGPDYLLQFSDPKVVTENTVRQGFAPPPISS